MEKINSDNPQQVWTDLLYNTSVCVLGHPASLEYGSNYYQHRIDPRLPSFCQLTEHILALSTYHPDLSAYTSMIVAINEKGDLLTFLFVDRAFSGCISCSVANRNNKITVSFRNRYV